MRVPWPAARTMAAGAVSCADTLRDGTGGRFAASTGPHGGDGLDLDARPLRQVLHRERAARRERLRDHADVDLVHAPASRRCRRGRRSPSRADRARCRPLRGSPRGWPGPAPPGRRRRARASSPVAGSDPSWPAVKTRSPARMAWLYAPTAAGAPSVLMASRRSSFLLVDALDASGCVARSRAASRGRRARQARRDGDGPLVIVGRALKTVGPEPVRRGSPPALPTTLATGRPARAAAAGPVPAGRSAPSPTPSGLQLGEDGGG